MAFEQPAIEPIDLSDEEKSRLGQLMTQAQPILSGAAVRIFGDADPSHFKRLQAEYRRGSLRTLLATEKAVLNDLQAIESVMLAGYYKLVHGLCAAFHNSRQEGWGLVFDDYLQEALWLIVDSIYTYRGEQEFSTYIYRVVKNRLIDMNRQEWKKMRGAWDLLKTIRIVKKVMRRENRSFEEAITLLEAETGRTMDESELERCRRIILAEDNPSSMEEVCDFSPESPLMREAVAKAPLDDTQRYILKAYLSGENGYQSRIAEELGITRAAVCLRWKRICGILLETYRRLQGGSVAA